MHFWIDKRQSTNYGVGANRHMSAGLPSYQPRRVRSKALPIRPPVPNASKTNNHRNRQIDSRAARIPQSVTVESGSLTPSTYLNQQYVPVIHSVYPRDEVSVVEISENNHWLPVKIICTICILLASLLLILKFYFDNELTGLQLSIFGIVSLIILTCFLTIYILRIRKTHSISSHRAGNDIRTDEVNNQILMQLHFQGSPPSYEEIVAISLPEKASPVHHTITTPPPSYDNIHIA